MFTTFGRLPLAGTNRSERGHDAGRWTISGLASGGPANTGPYSSERGCSDPGFDRDALLLRGRLQCLEVPLVLIGVLLRERGDRLVELVALAEVGRDRDPVARPCVRPRERLGAHLSVHRHRGGRHAFGRPRSLPIAQLPDVEVPLDAVQTLGALPPEEDVARGLHQALPFDDALPGVGELA